MQCKRRNVTEAQSNSFLGSYQFLVRSILKSSLAVYPGNQLDPRERSRSLNFFLHQTFCNILVNTYVRSIKFFVELPYSLDNTLVSTFLDSGYPFFWHPAKTFNFTNSSQLKISIFANKNFSLIRNRLVENKREIWTPPPF